jgi:hypothetical protein
MPQSAYGLIEMIFSFGVVLALLVWQLVVTRRGVMADRARAAKEQAQRESVEP